MTTPPESLAWTSCDDERVFSEPWQAHTFAITLRLNEQGLFTWAEWASALSAQIEAAQTCSDAGPGDAYYQHCLSALESIVTAKGASSATELERYRVAWDRAADRTPHGQPIDLQPQDFDLGGMKA